MTSELDNWKLPVDWELASIGNKFVFTRKPRGLRLENYERVPFIPMDRIPSDRLFFSDFALKPSSDITSGTYFEEGDLLVSKITPCFENGKQGIVRNIPGGFGIATTEVIPLKPIEGVSHLPFLAMYLLHRDIRTRLAGRMEGATGRQRLPKTVLEQWSMPFPPIAEQRAIADVLSKIQAAVEMQDRIVNTLKELKAATMAKLFHEGLESRGARLRETRFGDVPADWITVPLAEVAQIQTGVAKGRRFGNESVVELPYLRVANVQDGFLDLSEIKTILLRETERQRYSLQPGDVLLTEGGDFDKLGRGYLWNGQIANCVHQNHIFAVRTNRSKLLPEFFAYLAQCPYGKAYFLSVAHKTTNLACINSTKLKGFPVPLAPLAQQRKVVTALKKIDESIDLQTTRVRTLKSAFSSMLHMLMTGQVRISRMKPGGDRHG